jgi:uncharacterized protein (DUF2237 family)
MATRPKYLLDSEVLCSVPRCCKVFPARRPGQKWGMCDACCAERRRLAKVKTAKKGSRKLTDAENEELRTLERLTKRVSL